MGLQQGHDPSGRQSNHLLELIPTLNLTLTLILLVGSVFIFGSLTGYGLFKLNMDGAYQEFTCVNEIDAGWIRGDKWSNTTSVCIGDSVDGAVGEVFAVTSVGNLWRLLVLPGAEFHLELVASSAIAPIDLLGAPSIQSLEEWKRSYWYGEVPKEGDSPNDGDPGPMALCDWKQVSVLLACNCPLDDIIPEEPLRRSASSFQEVKPENAGASFLGLLYTADQHKRIYVK